MRLRARVLRRSVVAIVLLPMASFFAPGAAATEHDPVIVAVGDLACQSLTHGQGVGACRSGEIADLIRDIDPDRFLALGDIQYNNGKLSEFLRVWDVQFGDLRGSSRRRRGTTSTARPTPPATSPTSGRPPILRTATTPSISVSGTSSRSIPTSAATTRAADPARRRATGSERISLRTPTQPARSRSCTTLGTTGVPTRSGSWTTAPRSSADRRPRRSCRSGT